MNDNDKDEFPCIEIAPVEVGSIVGLRIMTDDEQVKFFEEQIKAPIYELQGAQFIHGEFSKQHISTNYILRVFGFDVGGGTGGGVRGGDQKPSG